MKILRCKNGQIFDIGFVDPDIVHQAALRLNSIDTENNLVKALRFFEPKGKYYFLTTTSEC